MCTSLSQPRVAILDDDADMRDSLGALLDSRGFASSSFCSPLEFIESKPADLYACLILDVHLGNENGMDFQRDLLAGGFLTPIIIMSGHGTIPMAVDAMRAGAISFVPKPCDKDRLMAEIDQAVQVTDRNRTATAASEGIRTSFATLTLREREVMSLVTAGLMNKQIAGRMGVQEITVKIHRGRMMQKMRAQSLADLVRMAELIGARETAASRHPSASASYIH